MFYRHFFVYFSATELHFFEKYFRILRFRAVIEIYNKMSEIRNFLLLALISQMPPYLIFILVSNSKSTCPVNMLLSSQNAQYFYLSAPLIVKQYKVTVLMKIYCKLPVTCTYMYSGRHLGLEGMANWSCCPTRFRTPLLYTPPPPPPPTTTQ
jgi:hypothetical protein